MTNTSSTSMYRQAAIDAHFTHQYGNPFVLPTYSQWLVSAGLSIWITLGFIYINTQPFYDTIETQGWLDTINANVDIRSQEAAGVVQDVYVENGSVVEVGQAIAKVNRSHGDALGPLGIELKRLQIVNEQKQNKAIQAQKSRNIQLKIDTLNSREFNINQQLVDLLKHREMHLAQTKKSEVRWQNLQTLANKGLITSTQLEQTELQMLTLQQSQFELYIQVQNFQNELDDLTQQKQELLITKGQISHEIKLLDIQTEAKLQQLNIEVSYVVRASASGQIDNLQIKTGDSIQFNQIMSHVAPLQAKFYVRLAVNTELAGAIQLDQELQIRIDGFPYQKFGSLSGNIKQIAKKVILPKDIQNLAIAINQPVYLVDVEIDTPPPNALLDLKQFRSGMTVKASIKKHQSTILEWLLEPIKTAFDSSFAQEKHT